MYKGQGTEKVTVKEAPVKTTKHCPVNTAYKPTYNLPTKNK